MFAQTANRETIEIATYSRLHFGLMEICPGEPFCYAGVGLMVESPQARIQARFGGGANFVAGAIQDIELIADPYWQVRARLAIEHWQRIHSKASTNVTSIRVAVPPEPHVGLGSGTQFACAMAALLEWGTRNALQPSDGENEVGILHGVGGLFQNVGGLGNASGRGKRSHIGLEGFLRGGLILDRGQPVPADSAERSEDSLDVRTEALEFPREWRILLWCDRSYQGDSGQHEAEAFEQCSRYPNPHRTSMLQCIHEQLLPALRSQDWQTASAAIGEYGAMAGEIFRPIQGGIYRSASIASKIALLQQLGCRGVGQSSWGPTLFAIASDEEHAKWLVSEIHRRVGEEEGRVQWTVGAGPATLRRVTSILEG